MNGTERRYMNLRIHYLIRNSDVNLDENVGVHSLYIFPFTIEASQKVWGTEPKGIVEVYAPMIKILVKVVS